MRNVERSAVPIPHRLSDERSDHRLEVLLEIFDTERSRLVQSLVGVSSGYFRSFQDEELPAALSRLFQGRCAFCEQRRSTDVHRFRPSEQAGPSSAAPPEDADFSHLYYCWLANSWQNHCFPGRAPYDHCRATLRATCPQLV